MKKLLLTAAVFGSLATFIACSKTPPISLALTPPIEVVTPAPVPIPTSVTLESLDKRVTDIETRMAKARAYWAKHRR